MRIRRIFRPSLAARLRVPLASLACLGLCAVLVPQAVPGNLFGATVPLRQLDVPAAEVRVLDGGTLQLGREVLRLRGLRVPERGRASCGAATGLAQDCGNAAAAALAGLIAGRAVQCSIQGADRHGRPYGTCAAGEVELNASLVAAGWAQADAEAAPALAALEAAARRDGRGAWGAASPGQDQGRRGL